MRRKKIAPTGVEPSITEWLDGQGKRKGGKK